MAYGYDPAAFDIIREEFQDRREEPERPERERDLPDRVREDDRDADEQRRIDDAKEALETVVNDDSITLSPEMVKAVNDPQVRMTRRGEITRLSGRDVIRRSGQFSRANILPPLPGKKKRKVSKYQKEFGKQLKKLKAKHPRTKITQLMKRAHTATRKALK